MNYRGRNIFCSNNRFSFLLLEYKGKPLLCFVDREDYDLIKNYRWRVAAGAKRSRTFYAYAHTRKPDGSYTTIQMHSLLFPDSKKVDHKNHNGLDNRRGNLRPSTSSQNQANTRKQTRRVTSSQFKGVSRQKGFHNFRARIYLNGKCTSLGFFSPRKKLLAHTIRQRRGILASSLA